MSSAPTIFALLDAGQAGADGQPLGAGPDPRARQQLALLALGRRVSARPPLDILLHDAVSLLTELLHADVGGLSRVVGRGAVEVRLTTVDREGHSVLIAKSPATLDPSASIVAFAMKNASPVVIPDLSAERRFTDVFLREQKIAAALVVPLPVDERPFGTLAAFCRNPHEYSVDDVRFAETIAHLVSTSAGRARAEEDLRRGRLLTDAVLEAVADVVFTLDLKGLVVAASRAARDKTGYRLEEVFQRPFASVFVTPDEAAAFQSVLELAQVGPQKFCGQLVDKNGRRTPIEWVLQAITVDDRAHGILATGRPCGASEDPAPFSPAGATPPGKDLRSSPRRNFHYRQLIAPMYNAGLPRKNDFYEVECKDISAGGISFYLDNPPDFQTLVVVLGLAPGLSYFTARVARVVEERINDRVRHVVGCRFIGRVHL